MQSEERIPNTLIKKSAHSIKNKVVQLGLLVKLTKCTQAN